LRTLFCLATLFAANLAASVVSSNPINFTVNLSGTKNGNAIDHVVIFGTDGVQTASFFGASLNPTGQTNLFAPFNFAPTSLLVVGMEGAAASPTCIGDGTVCNGNDTGTHVLFLVNSSFAQTYTGKHFSASFGLNNYHETDIITNLAAVYTSGDALAYLRTFFLSTDGQAAAFVPGAASVAMEYYIGTPVGTGTSTGAPEPASFAMMGGVLVVAGVLRKIGLLGK
jgi:hypothetical protein